jgi:hypothetical protein
MRRLTAFTLAALAAAAVWAATPQAGTTARPSGSALAALDWLAGTWVGTARGAEIEEHWLAPKGHMMLGVHRDLFPNGDMAFEFLRIESQEGGIVYLASPSGAPATSFPLIERGDRRVVFENPQHDFPRRISYWREGDTLHARVEGPRGEHTEAIEWTFRRQ